MCHQNFLAPTNQAKQRGILWPLASFEQHGGGLPMPQRLQSLQPLNQSRGNTGTIENCVALVYAVQYSL